MVSRCALILDKMAVGAGVALVEDNLRMPKLLWAQHRASLLAEDLEPLVSPAWNAKCPLILAS